MFAGVADPVAAGYVESLARPGGNVTGFTVYEYSIGGKWLELLKEIAPRVTRAAVLREAGIAAGPGLFGAIQALAPSLGLELGVVNVHDAGEIERAIAAFAQVSNGGVIVTGSPRQAAHRELIIALAAKYRLPAVYNARFFAASATHYIAARPALPTCQSDPYPPDQRRAGTCHNRHVGGARHD